MEQPIDYTALTERINRADLKRSTEEAIRSGESPKFSRTAWVVTLVLVSSLTIVVTAAPLGLIAIIVSGNMHWETITWGTGILVGGPIVLLTWLVRYPIISLYNVSIEGFTNSTRYRLRRFAAANGLKFFVTGGDPRSFFFDKPRQLL